MHIERKQYKFINMVTLAVKTSPFYTAFLHCNGFVDVGTHAQLMEKGGIYAEMYNSQAKWY